MVKVDLAFTMKASTKETGFVTVEVVDATDWNEAEEKAKKKLFKEFIVATRKHTKECWTFKPISPDEQDTNDKEA